MLKFSSYLDIGTVISVPTVFFAMLEILPALNFDELWMLRVRAQTKSILLLNNQLNSAYIYTHIYFLQVKIKLKHNIKIDNTTFI